MAEDMPFTSEEVKKLRELQPFPPKR